MTDLFLKIVNMSIYASYIILAVVIARLLLKKAPKWFYVVLRGIVGLRLIMPFSIESIFSLIPSAETISPQVLLETPEIHTGFPAFNNAVNPIIQRLRLPLKRVLTLCIYSFLFSLRYGSQGSREWRFTPSSVISK